MPAEPEPEENATPRGLRWGIKASFLNYIAGLPDGQAALGAGVEAIDDRNVMFPYETDGDAEGTPAGIARLMRFTGEVRFGGHRGMLFVRLAEPWLLLRQTSGELSVSDPLLEDDNARLTIVTFTLPPETSALPWTAADVRLAESGRAVFNEIYPAGEPFEPITIV